MRLDGLGKPPLAQATSDNIDLTKVQKLTTKEVKKAAEASGPGASGGEHEREEGRLGQILDLLQKAKRRKHPKKAVIDALRAYQRAAGTEELEGQVGQTLDRRI